MGKLHLLYEKVKFPIEVIFIGTVLLGIGNIFSNPVFGISDVINNDVIEALMEIMMRTGRFIVTNFPLIILLGVTSSKKHETAPVAALAGYAAFLIATAMFSKQTVSSNAYSSILGISISGSSVSWLNGTAGYPLQTGVFGAAAVAIIVCFSYWRRDKRKKAENLFFFSHDGAAVLESIVLCFLTGIGFAYIWPYFLKVISYVITFISRDTSNPMKLSVYGVAERVLTLSGLGTLIRQPFWFGTNGGSWSNIAGQVITGDVSIWTAKLNQSSTLYGTTGRFITPYYVLNIFAAPGLIAGMYSIETDKRQRLKKRLFMVIGMAASALCGTLLPLELTILLLSPLLYLIHLLIIGILYHVLDVLNIFLGYQASSSLTQAALPGTLSELLSYTSNPLLVNNIIKIVIIGIVVFVVYFLLSKLYFCKMAVGLLNPPAEEKTVNEIVKAIGGIGNILDVQASVSDLRIKVYDMSAVNEEDLHNGGAAAVYEDANNQITLHYGGKCWMLRKDILDQRRSLIRDVK